jgi:hypothetical protein
MKKILLSILFLVLLATSSMAQMAATVQNIVLTNAGQEYQVNIPVNASAVSIRSRNNQDFQVSSTQGGSGTTFFTVKAGQVYHENSILSGGQVLYVQTQSAGDTLEVLYWI